MNNATRIYRTHRQHCNKFQLHRLNENAAVTDISKRQYGVEHISLQDVGIFLDQYSPDTIRIVSRRSPDRMFTHGCIS